MLRAEFVKMKRTTLFWMHILVPIVGTGIVLWYYKRLGALDMNVKSIGEFLEILSLAFPTLSGIVCALGTEMEVDAGNMQVLLGGVAGKCRAGGVKLVALLLLGAMGTLLALGSYLVGIYVFWRIFQWRATTFYCGVSFYTSWNADCYLCHPFFSESKVA